MTGAREPVTEDGAYNLADNRTCGLSCAEVPYDGVGNPVNLGDRPARSVRHAN